jgi:glycosyltransferase involved in cell wall biosynthesis
MVAREAELAERAALITVTSEQLGEKWAPRHPRVRPLPNGVPDGFLAACLDAAPPADIAAIPGPRLLYIGVISRWLDDALLAQLACIHPEWSLVLVGPVEAASRALRQLPNVHLLGARAHDELPGYLAGWDGCLLPFARNDSTRFISPTKTLEYMAAELPIVSTPITDVAEPYGHIAYLGSSPAEFLEACEAALQAGPEERADRTAQMRRVLAGTSWDVTVASMETLLAAMVSKKVTVPA